MKVHILYVHTYNEEPAYQRQGSDTMRTVNSMRHK